MNASTSFYIGIMVQIAIGAAQVGAAIFFVYRWQRRSWQFTNLMQIRAPLARAYCSLSAVVRARHRMAEDAADPVKAGHDREQAHRYLAQAQDDIVAFSVEHFKARFWLSHEENLELDRLFDKLREEWKAVRNEIGNPEDHLDDLRREILKFDVVCGIKNYGMQWSHVALHE